ncbi:MAG: hypothetical protein E7298_14370 [Lachnospiraceae bacterium]|nr:hypothetical protein [Lachnospiraceae bacterium]
MKIEMGESLFYSWLRHVKDCQVVQTNWKVSPQWELRHEEAIRSLMEITDRHFSEKYGYKIYKKNASLSQIIQQGECDAVGISIHDGTVKVFAVDVAFHEAGLNYGTRQETVMKIVAKSLRTAMCLYGFLDTRAAEIVFASPKINPAILKDAMPCVDDANELLQKQGFDFHIRVIANEDFNDVVLQPILLISNGVADTSELFLRSYQMYQMFSSAGKANRAKKEKQTETQPITDAATDEMKVGTMANVILRRLLESGTVSDEEIATFQSLEESKRVFSLSYPLLVSLDAVFPHERYYVAPLTIHDKQYRMTSQWTEHHREPLQLWIDAHKHS